MYGSNQYNNGGWNTSPRANIDLPNLQSLGITPSSSQGSNQNSGQISGNSSQSGIGGSQNANNSNQSQPPSNSGNPSGAAGLSMGPLNLGALPMGPAIVAAALNHAGNNFIQYF